MTQLTTRSYVKIVLLVLLATVIVGAAFFSGCSEFRIILGNSNLSETGNVQLDAGGIENIDLDWAAGSVEFTVHDGDDILLTESAAGTISRAQQMRWQVSGDTLKIDYGTGFSCANFIHKHLEISIPKRLAENFGRISIDGASGEYVLRDIACSELQFSLASGSIHASSMRIGDLNIDNASGDITVTGDITGEIKTDTASGSVDIACGSEMPESIDVGLASGDVSIAIPENDGFTLSLDKLSGNFNSDFPTRQDGKNHIYKEGGTEIKVDMASGTFELKKS